VLGLAWTHFAVRAFNSCRTCSAFRWAGEPPTA
jgi:hypothetical protein